MQVDAADPAVKREVAEMRLQQCAGAFCESSSSNAHVLQVQASRAHHQRVLPELRQTPSRSKMGPRRKRVACWMWQIPWLQSAPFQVRRIEIHGGLRSD